MACIIFAPQLGKCIRKFLGLLQIDKASEWQKDGMCWEKEDELYHDGESHRIMARDWHSVPISTIADGYHEYDKKEIKSQISYVANMFGICDEDY
jgi:hypothetical protein